MKRITFIMLFGALVFTGLAQAAPTNISDWEDAFLFSYDYVLEEKAGLDRAYEPVEVTLTVPGPAEEGWRNHLRVVRMLSDSTGEITPHDILGPVAANTAAKEGVQTPHSVESVNVIFLAQCAAYKSVTYKLFWGIPEGGLPKMDLPTAQEQDPLRVSGELPGILIENAFYRYQLSPKSGVIKSAIRAGLGEDEKMFYKTIPMHFGTDIWSPDQAWDHDYDWPEPPNQKLEGGQVALRYHRWGPLHTYSDVIVSITYTFYANVPWVNVSSTMTLTKDRSAHAVRMGEIVVTHSEAAKPKDDNPLSKDTFTHYAWPKDGSVITREINAFRNENGEANVPGQAVGGLGILDRDTTWIAGFNAEKQFGLATLRKHQFVGNQTGGATPHAAPCTYVANYGWGFVYWSRPMVYPLGAKGDSLDQNTALAAGTLFATEEALLMFEPDSALQSVQDAHTRYTVPLRLNYYGTGPW